eukprot:9240362-Ditylum_brightwellii.AAC.1
MSDTATNTTTNMTTNKTTDTATDAKTATMASSIALDTMATTTTTITTHKHQVREKDICSKCGASIYHLRRHMQESCPGVGNENVPITLFKNEKPGRFISGCKNMRDILA